MVWFKLSCSVYSFRLQSIIKKLSPDLSGKNAVIIGRSNIVGKPMAALLLGMNATVTIAFKNKKYRRVGKLC